MYLVLCVQLIVNSTNSIIYKFQRQTDVIVFTS